MDNDNPIITVDKIVEKSRQWSLEGDCALLQWMDQISKNLEDRVTKTSSALNELSTKLDRTSVALCNATNNLAALQYSQFVENRVHDDDETLANVAEVPNPATDVTDTTAGNHNIYSFLKKNLEMMNSCHEAYSISYDDSDEDEPATNVVYRSKNPYEARSLPHIYGSNLWKEKWHIGLCDSDNDFSGDEQSEQFSESSSTADDSYESTAPTMSEWDSTAWGLNKNHLVEREEIHTPSNDGESSCQGDNYSQSEVSTPRAQRSIPITQPIQEQRYYQHVPRKNDNIFDDIFTDSEQQVIPQVTPQVVPPLKNISPNIFIANEPPPDVLPTESDNNRRIGAKKPLNLFDDDEFSSFMDQIVQTATNKNTKSINLPEEKGEPPKKTVLPNLFEDSEDILVPNDTKPEMVTSKQEVPNLEDDIFMPPPLPTVTEKLKTRNLFDDDDDDDDFESMFAAKPSGSNKFTQKTKNLFEDDLGDLNVQSTKESLVPSVEKVSLPSSKEATVKEVPLMRKGLFDDDDEDELEKKEDLFARKPVTKDIFENIFTKHEPITNVSSLETDLFGDVEQEAVKKAVPKKQELPVEDLSKVEPANSSRTSVLKTDLFADVFQDEAGDHMFALSSEKKKTKVADIFAEDFTDDFEEFIPKVAASKAENVVTETKGTPVVKPTTTPKLPDIARKPFVPNSNKKLQDEFKNVASSKSSEISKATIDKKPEDELESFAAPKSSETAPIIDKNSQNEIQPIVPIFSEAVQDEVKPATQKVDKAVKAAVSVIPQEEDISRNESSSADVKRINTDNQNILPEDKKQPTITVLSYTSLFHDEPPPDDDEDPIVPSYEEPPKYTADEDEIVTTPVVPYSNISLFADVPPDDDFTIVPPAETKRIHSIFYDDFHETIEASREMRAPSTYIFNDEPPPDDDLQSPKTVHEYKPKVEEEKKDKAKVSKLKKSDLKINVGALLPTAKIPSFKKAESASEPISVAPKGDGLTSEIPTVKLPKKQTRDIPENILPNLNRDRAKLQVKRRPSTRKGRQESYIKSMIEEEIVPSEEEQEPDGKHRVGEVWKTPKSLFKDFGTFDVNKITEVHEITSTTSKEETFETITSVKQMTGQESLFEEPEIFVKKTAEPSTTIAPSLFPTDAGNIFETVRSHTEKPQTASKILDSLFDSDDIDENPFGSPTKIPSDFDSSKTTPVAATKSVSKAHNLSESAALGSIFNESESEEKLAPPTKTAFKASKEPVKPSSLFGESDDGSDDIFKESKTPKKPALQKPVEKKPKAKPVNQPTKPVSSLFSSDEESVSGDDIFGKPKTKAAPKKIDVAKAKPSASLFADLTDDDDDDLFGTTKKKPSGAEKSKSKTSTTNLQPTKSSAQAQAHQQTATSNNPLSDLLDP